MKRILVINPNTSESVSSLLQRHIDQALSGGAVPAQARTVTARFGAPYIADEVSYQVAGHAVLDAWDAERERSRRLPDGALIGCFGDPGLWALRECSPAPVTGLAEAAFTEAARLGRFAVVTGGERWGPMLQRLALQLGFAPSLAGVWTVAPSGAEMAADPAAARQVLAQACEQALAAWAPQAIIIGGAGLAGMAALLQPACAVPLIDSVEAGVRQLLERLGAVQAPGLSAGTPP